MKKLLLLSCMLLMCVFAHAQLADGSTAPNFIAKDINGNTWNLYDILESGRPVIMDVSATWCPPCWNYHNSGALELYFAEHGPEGDGTSFVFYVEGDGSTNTNCLYGPSGCNSSTMGNWVANTPYPIIDNATIANQYDIAYFPTIYLITPDKKVKEIGNVPAAALWAQAEPTVQPIPERWGRAASFNAHARSNQFCGAQEAKPDFMLTNLGTVHIEKAIVELRWNGTMIQSKEIITDLAPLSQELVIFDAVNITTAGTLSVHVVSINDAPNGQVEEAGITINNAEEKYVGQQVEVRLRTDASAKDIYWAILNDAGVVVAEGGNTAVGINGGGAFPNGAPDSPTTYANSTNITKVVDVPNGCFSFVMVDAKGDGMLLPGNVKLRSAGNTSNFFTMIGTDYSTYSGNAFAQVTSGTQQPSGVAALVLTPNPAQDVLNLGFDLLEAGNVRLNISNSIGQQVMSNTLSNMNTGSQQIQLDLNRLQNGLYFLQVQTDNGAATVQPFVVAK